MSRKNKEKKRREEQRMSVIEEQINAPEEEDKPREKSSSDVIGELFEVLETGGGDGEADIESDIADMGAEEDDGAGLAENPKKRKFFFGLAVFIVIMAAVGVFAMVRTIIYGVGMITDNTSVKEEVARFIMPVVSNDIAPFDNEAEISNSVKISCSVWNIMLNKDLSLYKKTSSGEIIIPEYDADVSCKELFGPQSELIHRSTGSSGAQFLYSETDHTYTCTYNLRYISYTPSISSLDEGSDGICTVRVDYISPAMYVLNQNLKKDPLPEKTMEYIILRNDGKNTLISVRNAGQSEE